jgi:hypothetical protein
MDNLIPAKLLRNKLTLTPRTIIELAQAGNVPHVKINNRIRFSMEMIDQWIKKNTFKEVE